MTKKLGNIYGMDGGNYAGNVWDKNYISPAILCVGDGGGGNLPSSSNRVIQIGSAAHQIISNRDNPQRYRVYHTDGIAPTLNTAQGGGLNPYIIDYAGTERN